MVKIYKRKTNRGDCSEKTMKNGVDSVLRGKMGLYLAAKTFGVPLTTLEREVKMVRVSSKENASATMNMKIEREPIIEVTTATIAYIGLAAAAEPLFNCQIFAPTVTEAQPIIVIEPNCLEVIPLATSATKTSSPKPGCSS
ncbi:hypothetical protein HHI36_014123 [Cryptolaemus montrouzieri]|uniref:HTH psq-type domain-containing protein n=1 Tax=Cryptolaemus montrouzieri TaxID=559131 RepID=A0ABD2N1K1_9CUCU